MCGIFGFNFEDKSLLKKGTKKLLHRGPDEAGYFTEKGCSIGMRRLAIIDLKGGAQPQHNEDNTLWIVFNGEIFNYKDLKEKLIKKGHKFYTNSDTEVIIHGFEEWSEKICTKLRGQFAFCIYNTKNKSFFIARDKLGITPLYYFFDGETFSFASEIKAILELGINRKLNKTALDYYLSLQYTPAPLTLFENVFKVDAGEFVTFKDGKLRRKKYWSPAFDIDSSISEKEAVEKVRSLVEESVKIRLMSEVPLGAYLSGGLDSTTVVALMSKYKKEPVKTFSIGFEEGSPVNEVNHSRFVSEHFETDHKEHIVRSDCYNVLPKIVWHLDDLISDGAVVPVYFLSKFAKKKVSVVLTGDGGDEVFGGYRRYHYSRISKRYSKYIPHQLTKAFSKVSKYLPEGKARRYLNYASKIKDDKEKYLSHISIQKKDEKKELFKNSKPVASELVSKFLNKKGDLMSNQQNFDIQIHLPNGFNMKTDKMSMANSVESRVPLLDERLVEFSGKLPSTLKMRNGEEKYILKRAMKGIVPDRILKRRKQGFGTPMGLWMKKGMNELSDSVLEKLGKRNILSKRIIEKVRMKRKEKNYELKAWNLIMFEMWHETFLDKGD